MSHCPRRIVYPTKHNMVHHCTHDMVEHVHPSHTTVMNHHLTKNKHVYPHSTSVVNTANSVDVYGGSYQVPAPPRPTPGVGPVAGPGAGVPGAVPGPVPGPGVAPGVPRRRPW
ncbi:CotD family spore coat protein [Oceanobacillus halotolerans]|uniref:CotD family spore coat protein n=1 Tax=Oceanobacillus halotolerans TaxID=2663380 RepID=UPI0013DB8BE8|nr:CotD family spore coat protein [Oceanobacillus halotolerans]